MVPPKIPIKKYNNLTEFQRWCIHYIHANEKLEVNAESNLDNFCDKTIMSVDINKYDDEMASFNKQLSELSDMGLLTIRNRQILKHPGIIRSRKNVPNMPAINSYYVLSKIGKFYLEQQLRRQLLKLKNKENIPKIKSLLQIRKSNSVFEYIINNCSNLVTISSFLTSNSINSMELIVYFGNVVRSLIGL